MENQIKVVDIIWSIISRVIRWRKWMISSLRDILLILLMIQDLLLSRVSQRSILVRTMIMMFRNLLLMEVSIRQVLRRCTLFKKIRDRELILELNLTKFTKTYWINTRMLFWHQLTSQRKTRIKIKKKISIQIDLIQEEMESKYIITE